MPKFGKLTGSNQPTRSASMGVLVYASACSIASGVLVVSSILFLLGPAVGDLVRHIPIRLLQSNLTAGRSARARFATFVSTLGLAVASLAVVACGDGMPGGSGGAPSATGGVGAQTGSGGSAGGDGSGSTSAAGGASGGAESTGGADSSGGADGVGGTGTGGGGGESTGGAGGGPSVDGSFLPDLTGKTETACTVSTTADLSDEISTVGIVEFTSDLAGQTDAVIEFGLTTDYGLVAPVDFGGSNRTLLLGMTTDS